MRIQHNIMAMNSYRNLSKNNGALSKNLEKLSSGYRINRAGDDAAGLAISEKMRSQIAGLDQAQKNAQSGINLVQTAEGALTEVHDMLNRMVTLATQAANGTYTSDDQAKIQSEIAALKTEIDRIGDNSNFNGTKLLNGGLEGGYELVSVDGALGADVGISEIDVSKLAGKYTLGAAASGTASLLTVAYDSATTTFTMEYTADDATAKVVENVKLDSVPADGTQKTVTFSNGLELTVNAKLTADIGATALDAAKASGGLQLQIGSSSDETIEVSISDMRATALGINGLNLNSVTAANEAIDTINQAIEKVSVQRSSLGAIQNRLEHTINNLGVMEENIQDAEANIRDTDIADEMMAYTKNNILIQSAQAMLAQANQVPQGVLQLMQ